MDTLRSRQNPLFKQLLKLSESRRERLKQRQTLLVGTHLLASALDAGWPLQRLLLRESDGHADEVQALLARAHDVPRTALAPELFEAVEQLPSSTGLMALVAVPSPPAPRRDGGVVALDGVQDPGNVGSILRTCAAAGVDEVWLSPACADAWSPRVLRAAMGAHCVLPVIERLPLAPALAAFGGRRAITALDASTDLYDTALAGDLALVLGAEGAGVSDELVALADLRLRIPMAPGVESLNVGAAAAVCLFERLRQRRGSL